MLFDQEIVDELIEYKKGDIIPNPDELIHLRISFGYKQLIISRRSIAHILQKDKISRLLLDSLEKCINDFDNIFLSDKSRSADTKRLIIFKRNVSKSKNIAVVIEHRESSHFIRIITIMIADEKYLIKKYKKLR